MGLRALPGVEPRLRADQARVVRRLIDDRLVVTRALVDDVQSQLGHRTLATTSRYLAHLKAETDAGWAAAAAAIGL